MNGVRYVRTKNGKWQWRYDHQTAAEMSKARRRRLAEKKLCINGESHGPATHGCRCYWCREVYVRGVDVVLADPKMDEHRPPKYRVIERKLPLTYEARTKCE